MDVIFRHLPFIALSFPRESVCDQRKVLFNDETFLIHDRTSFLTCLQQIKLHLNDSIFHFLYLKHKSHNMIYAIAYVQSKCV